MSDHRPVPNDALLPARVRCLACGRAITWDPFMRAWVHVPVRAKMPGGVER